MLWWTLPWYHLQHHDAPKNTVLHCQLDYTMHGHLLPHCPRLLLAIWQWWKGNILRQITILTRFPMSTLIFHFFKKKRLSLFGWAVEPCMKLRLFHVYRASQITREIQNCHSFLHFRFPFPSAFCCHWLCSSFCLPRLFHQRHLSCLYLESSCSLQWY